MLSKSPILEASPLCLRATGGDITEIDILSPQLAQALSLFVSNNSITSLVNITQFRSLERLLIEYNELRYIDDLYPLAELQKLRELRLQGNPLCNLPLFVVYVLYLLPNLMNLNGNPINEFPEKNYTNAQIDQYVKMDNELLRMIALADFILINAEEKHVDRIDTAFSKYYTPNKYRDYTHEIRKKSPSKTASGYFNYLKSILEQKHQIIQEKFKDNELKAQVHETHASVLILLEESKEYERILENALSLSDIAVKFIEAERRTRDRSSIDRMSRISSIISLPAKLFLAKSAADSHSIASIRRNSKIKDSHSVVTSTNDAQRNLEQLLGLPEQFDDSGSQSSVHKSVRSKKHTPKKSLSAIDNLNKKINNSTTHDSSLLNSSNTEVEKEEFNDMSPNENQNSSILDNSVEIIKKNESNMKSDENTDGNDPNKSVKFNEANKNQPSSPHGDDSVNSLDGTDNTNTISLTQTDNTNDSKDDLGQINMKEMNMDDSMFFASRGESMTFDQSCHAFNNMPQTPQDNSSQSDSQIEDPVVAFEVHSTYEKKTHVLPIKDLLIHSFTNWKKQFTLKKQNSKSSHVSFDNEKETDYSMKINSSIHSSEFQTRKTKSIKDMIQYHELQVKLERQREINKMALNRYNQLLSEINVTNSFSGSSGYGY